MGTRYLGEVSPRGRVGQRPRWTAQVAAWGDVLVTLQSEVAVNYIQMRVQEQRIMLTRQNAELQAKTLRLVELRYNKGLVTDLDVQRPRPT